MVAILDSGFDLVGALTPTVEVHVLGEVNAWGPLGQSPGVEPDGTPTWSFDPAAPVVGSNGVTIPSYVGYVPAGSDLLQGLATPYGQCLGIIGGGSASQSVWVPAGYYRATFRLAAAPYYNGSASAWLTLGGVHLDGASVGSGAGWVLVTSQLFKVRASAAYTLSVTNGGAVSTTGLDSGVFFVDQVAITAQPIALGRVGTIAAPTRTFQVAGFGDGTMPPSGPGALITPPVPPRVRLRGEDGVSWWEHDGNTFSVYDSGVRTLKAPLPTGGGTPELVVGMDPITNVPAKYPYPTLDAPPPPLPSGGYGDLVWFNGTDWVVLVPTAIEGDKLELVDTGGAALQPQWGGGDGRNHAMAGSLYLTDALVRAYTVTMSIMKSELQAAILAGIIAGSALSMSGLHDYLVGLENPHITTALTTLGLIFDAAADVIDAILGVLLGPLAPEVIHNLSWGLYQVLLPQAFDHTIHFGDAESDGWRVSIFDHSTATVLQKALLAALVLFYPVEKWEYWLSVGQTGSSSNWKTQAYE